MERVGKGQSSLISISLASILQSIVYLKCVLWQGECRMAKESFKHFKTKGKYKKEYYICS